MTEPEATLELILIRAAQKAGIRLPLKGSETFTAKQFESFVKSLVHEPALLKKDA